MSLIAATFGRLAAPARRTMAVACGAHILHDGYTDLLYVLLPLWQVEFGLGYAEVELLRAFYVGAMAGFQVPAGLAAERFGGPFDPRSRHCACRGWLSGRRGEPRLCDAGRRADPGRPGFRRAASDRRSSRLPGFFRPALTHRARGLQFLRRSREDGVPGGDRLAADHDAVANGDDDDRHRRA